VKKCFLLFLIIIGLLTNASAVNFSEVINISFSAYKVDSGKQITSTANISGIVVLDENISIYPNPTNGIFTIKQNIITGTATTIKIYNLSAQLIFSKRITTNKLVEINELHDPGLYFVELINDKGSSIKRSMVLIQ
jgi:hypothetical protein